MSEADDRLLEAGNLVLKVNGAVATILLNRPDVRNAQTPDTWAALARIPDLLGPEVRVVLVRGIGKSFSAGLDRRVLTDGTLAGVASLPPAEGDAWIATFQDAFSWLSDPARITIAVVQGHAIGAGFQLALACALIVAAEDAEFAMAEVTLGMVPDLGGIHRLATAVGERRALELCASGRRFGAAEALQIGIVARVVPVGDLSQAANQLATSFLANPAPAVAAISRLVSDVGRRSSSEQLELERSEQLPLLRALMARPPGWPRTKV